jgi:ADP-ribose pyrophosphatase YjhB (NUDIX family)
MPHLHDLIDYTVNAYVVHGDKVLLIHHTELSRWLALGGHVSLDEDPEAAVIRIAKKESGLDIRLIGSRPAFTDPDNKPLVAPAFMDIHPISPTHRHIGMSYMATSTTDAVTKAPEHDLIRWFTDAELDDPANTIAPAIRFYAKEALKMARIAN